MTIGEVKTLQKSEMMRINFDNLRRDVSVVTVASHSQTGGCCTICDMQKSYYFYEYSHSL
jgi:tRNA G10  N-methylase Trm11